MSELITASRYHDISCGHRVVGHESKCRHLHGHNYRITFEVGAPALDGVGRIIDFSVIKSRLCMWLEEQWDHKFLLWEKDPLRDFFVVADNTATLDATEVMESLVFVPFNPTAENMASYLLHIIGPKQLDGTGARLISVDVSETRKCSATAIDTDAAALCRTYTPAIGRRLAAEAQMPLNLEGGI